MKQINNAFLRDENILTLFSLNNLIIPEIQREYVWGKNNKVLGKFLNDLKDNANICNICHHGHGNHNINIGFLYSYKPPYVKFENERFLDEYLIDGQQRITTIFLLLLTRAVKENRVEDFCNIIRYNEESKHMSFSYKVRNLTQDFLLRLVRHIVDYSGKNSLDFFLTDEFPYWFLADYYEDPTISSMTSAIKMMLDNTLFPEEEYYFDYLLESIHFWHFKTEATSQGEELYISMNSRGEQLSNNETQKAASLPPEEQKEWGEKWEKWQTFFWRNRNKGNKENPNINADKGFNQYLECINSLERFNYELSWDETIPETTFINFHADIKDIKVYMDALKFISKKENFNLSVYAYKEWYDSFLIDIWTELNKNESSWYVSKSTYNNNSIAKNKAMLFWSWMYYYKLKGGNIDTTEMLRLIHFYYIRFHCYKRSARPLFKIIKDIVDNGFCIYNQLNGNNDEIDDEDQEGETDSRLFSNEEIKLSKICNLNSTAPFRLESACWKLQDIEYILEGKKVGGNTIYDFLTYISDNNEEMAISDMETLYSDLNTLFNDADNFNKVKSLLLFYSNENGYPFWQRQSPDYYNNYECSLKKRIVRCQAFLDFYDEYRKTHNLDSMLEDKRNSFFSKHYVFDFSTEMVPSMRDIVIVYDAILSSCSPLTHIWSNNSIAFRYFLEEKEIISDRYLYRNQNKLWSLYRYFGDKYVKEIILPENWRQKLINDYPNISFEFKNYNT